MNKLLVLTFGLWLLPCAVTLAQSPPPACQRPQVGEYLVLVVNQTKDTQTQLQNSLPANFKTITCKYLDNTVVRLSGFKNLDDANSWARYISESLGFQAFVARQSDSSASASSTKPPAYNPQPLGDGYAVLVNYSNKPEVAVELGKVLDRDIGLVSYGQRPYLLASYATEQSEANIISQQLSDRGFRVMVVNSRRVIVLKQKVALSGN